MEKDKLKKRRRLGEGNEKLSKFNDLAQEDINQSIKWAFWN